MNFKNQIEQTIKSLNKDVDNFAKKVVDETGKEIERATRRNFDNSINEVPADDPLTRVYSMPIMKAGNKYSKTILCEGRQVLFIEFGAGVSHYYESSTISLENGENAPRKSIGVLDIGEYGHHRGKDDVWFYKSKNRRESRHSHFSKVNKNGEFIMITSGIRPVRALWRATRNALKKLNSGRIKIK